MPLALVPTVSDTAVHYLSLANGLVSAPHYLAALTQTAVRADKDKAADGIPGPGLGPGPGPHEDSEDAEEFVDVHEGFPEAQHRFVDHDVEMRPVEPEDSATTGSSNPRSAIL
ncbi:hypothetical protein FRC08_001971 [Ceratobasidium sp. 394]|nr:hypothetical protein FRC08_001971 [Ceratobasidium sp. 394]